MTHVHVNALLQYQLLGDSLAQVPFLQTLAVERGEHIRVTGTYHEHVIPLLENLPLVFDRGGSPDGAEFSLHAQNALDTCIQSGFTLHMAQCYFRLFGRTVPVLPIHLPLKSEPCGLPPGIVVSPFSVSDSGNNKLWPHDRWVRVVQTLRRLGLADRVYILGAGAGDCASAAHYAVAGIETVFNRSLPKILDLLRSAPLVMTLDNGLGHLAHFGGVQRHVMIYPGCLAPKFAEAPRANIVRGHMPANVSVDQVLEAARQVLEAPCQVKVITC
jgi:hypothetical protein